MSDLPTIEQVRGAMAMKGGTDRHMHAMRLLEARADGRLKSRDEMDLEAAEVPAIDTFAMFAAKMLCLSHEAAMRRADVQEAGALVAKATLDAAWGVADEDS